MYASAIKLGSFNWPARPRCRANLNLTSPAIIFQLDPFHVAPRNSYYICVTDGTLEVERIRTPRRAGEKAGAAVYMGQGGAELVHESMSY